MIQDKIFFDEKDPTGVSYNTPFTVYGSYQGRLWSKTPSGTIKYYTQNSDLSVYATTGSNQFSGSQTVTGSLTVTGGITGSVTTASYVEYTGVANKPSGIVSSSVQVRGYNVFATTGSNQFEGAQDVTGSLTVTGSFNLNDSATNFNIVGNSFGQTYLQSLNGAIVLNPGYGGVEITGVNNRFNVTDGYITNLYASNGVVSGSSQIVEYNVFATTGSNQFNGAQAITGSLTVTGQVVAQTLNVQQVTSSIVYSSGSNIFGNDLGNTQQFTGSVSVTGSLAINGTSAVTGTGTTNYLPKFTGTSTIGNSLLTDNGTNIGLGIANPTAGRLQINVSDTTTAAHFQVVDGTTTLANSFVTNFRNANDGDGRYSLSRWQAQNAVSNDQIGFIGVQSVTGAGSYAPNIVFGQRTGVSTYTTRMTLDSSGNLGLGVTPSAWGSLNTGTLQLQNGALYRFSSTSFGIVNNGFYNGTNWIYSSNGLVADYYQETGQHIWRTAPSGTSNCAISFTQAMTLDACGNLLIGETSNIGSGRKELVMRGVNGSVISLGNETTADRLQIVSDSGENALIINKANTPMLLYTNNTERLRIFSTGAACFACELTAKSLGTNDLILNNLNHDHANYVDGTRGSWLIQEGACDLFIINQVSCKKYKFNLIEIN